MLRWLRRLRFPVLVDDAAVPNERLASELDAAVRELIRTTKLARAQLLRDGKGAPSGA